MELTLALGALLLGLAGTPHCAAMCGAACAAVVGRGDAAALERARLWAFLGARTASYAVAGAVVAAGVGLAAAAGSAAPVLRPVWLLLHIGALALGLWLAVTGRQPGWMTRLPAPRRSGWQTVRTPWTAAAAGSAWAAWPCGLLQSALIMAGLANSAPGGAMVMACFAVASAGGLAFGPWALARLSARGAGQVSTWAIRLAGLMLAAGSAWAMGHGVWQKVLDYCFG